MEIVFSTKLAFLFLFIGVGTQIIKISDSEINLKLLVGVKLFFDNFISFFETVEI